MLPTRDAARKLIMSTAEINARTAGDMEDGECILCGNCEDGCSKDAIRFSFSAGR